MQRNAMLGLLSSIVYMENLYFAKNTTNYEICSSVSQSNNLFYDELC